ncbi:thiamine phosphate synthase [Shewanella sp.]|uniref:thiamine phosphate synthase n=1 Tax=Shewanella sp. TaxID=50422 RepID=UPI003561EFB1
MAKINDMASKPIVWSIAGSDSGGGAGLQADLLTIHDLGCHGCSVITAITAQNSVAVTAVEAVSPAMLAAQLEALKADLYPSAVKIGLIANQAQLDFLAHWLGDNLPGVPVILDTVMVASCGDNLQASPVPVALDFRPLARTATLITPNFTELSRLSAMLGARAVTDEASWVVASQTLAHEFGVSVLAKGGDVAWQRDTARDLLLLGDIANISPLYRQQGFLLDTQRVNTRHNHGSGCTLASAIACFLARGMVLPDAVLLAKAYVFEGLNSGYGVGHGPGPLARTGVPTRFRSLPGIKALESPVPFDGHFASLPKKLGVYPVVADIPMLHTLLEAGATTIQLRIKTDLPGAEDEANIIRAIELGKRYGARVFINDHWQLAIKHDAFGVHLGQEDVNTAALECIASAGMALGLSSHGLFEALMALRLGPSYLALGHIFPTTTKTMPSPPQGLEVLALLNQLLGELCPTVAIGGIDETNLTQVAATGVANIAVVRAVTEKPNPAAALKMLVERWEARDVV